jgi:aspartate racemase
MGPAATADSYSKLVRATPARIDQAHLRVAIWSDPGIPDRTAALFERGPDPTHAIATGALTLASLGCDLIAMPCNTAHAFLPAVQKQLDTPILHMVEATVRRTTMTWPAVRRVGILATSGTLRAGLYQQELSHHGLESAQPGAEDQDRLTDAIAAVKAGTDGEHDRESVARIAHRLLEEGIDALILACTEVPLLLPSDRSPAPAVDSTQCLAEAVVARVWDQAATERTCRSVAETVPRSLSDRKRAAKHAGG